MADQQSTSQSEKSSVTVTVESDETDALLQQNVSSVRLKLRKPKSGKKVNWSEETVDNENMDKKKSKCCCIYKKPRGPEDDSSSEDDSDECEHCYGHVEKKKKTPKDSASPSRTESNVTKGRHKSITLKWEPQYKIKICDVMQLKHFYYNRIEEFLI